MVPILYRKKRALYYFGISILVWDIHASLSFHILWIMQTIPESFVKQKRLENE